MRITLPEMVEFTCPHCGDDFGVKAEVLDGRTLLTCPVCQGEFNLSDGLTPHLRKRFYYRLRGIIEGEVGEQFYEVYQELLEEQQRDD